MALEETDWNELEKIQDINTRAEKFSALMNQALDKIAPIKTFKARPQYVHGLSEETKLSMKRRDQARFEVRNVLLLPS